MEKCLPTSRRKSTIPTRPSQSRLLAMRAGLPVTSKSRKCASCEWMPAALASASSFDSSARSAAFSDGSPIRPVPPPTSATGVCPARCRCTSPMMGSRLPTCRLEAVGSKPI